MGTFEAQARKKRLAMAASGVLAVVLFGFVLGYVERMWLGAPDSEVADPTDRRAGARAELTQRVAERGRLVVLGLDGLDWNLVDQLTAQDVMPELRRLLSRSAQAALEIPEPLISPVVWTTIATGQPPEVHGVLDFLESDPMDGSIRPVSSVSRRVPAIWEMTAAAGRSTAVIGWWATFPASASEGLAVYSDRLTEQLLGLAADAPGVAAPAAAAAVAHRLRVKPEEVTAPMLTHLAVVESSELDAARQSSRPWEDPIGGLVRLVAATASVERLTAHELASGTQVVLSYLEGTDTVGHLFAAHRPPALHNVPQAAARRFGGVPDRFHAAVDRWIGEVARAIGPQGTLVIVSDHGFLWGPDRPPAASGAHTATAVWWHRPEGVFLAAGPGVRASSVRQRLGVLDVLPSLLALAGLPAASGVEGNVPEWLFEERRTPPASEPFDYLALIDRPSPLESSLPTAAASDEIAKLRALGYLGGVRGDDASPPSAPTSTFSRNRAESRRLNNLGASQLASGRTDAAEQSFRRAVSEDATYAAPHHNLSILYRNRGQFDEADREFWIAVEHGVADPEMSVVRLALDYRKRGSSDRAVRLLSEGRRRFPRSVPIWLNSGAFLGELGRFAEARACLERTVELQPDNPIAYRNLAAALVASGEIASGREALARAALLDPTDEEVRRELAALGGPPTGPLRPVPRPIPTPSPGAGPP